MMQKFDLLGKINFIDSNGVVVGYELGQDCCEYADYGFTKDPTLLDFETHDKFEHFDFDKYNFDKSFFVQKEHEDLDDGKYAMFKLDRDCDESIYLYLFNVHNGYYSHGFTFSIPFKEDSL